MATWPFTRYCFTSRLLCTNQPPVHPPPPPPACIAHPCTILLHDHCEVYVSPSNSRLYAIDHTMLVMTVSCKGQMATCRRSGGGETRCDEWATGLGLYKIVFCFWAFAHKSILLFAPILFRHPTPPVIAYTIAQSNASPRPPVIAIHTTQYWPWQYRVEANTGRVRWGGRVSVLAMGVRG